MVIILCIGLLLVVGIVQTAVYFSSPEQRAKVCSHENFSLLIISSVQVLPYTGFNINAVVTSRAKARARRGQS